MSKIETLHPYYQPIAREILLRAAQCGIFAFITQARRSRELQACIYARGRVAAGKSATYGGLAVHTFLSKDRKNVVARCGTAEYTVRTAEWGKIVTTVLLSWHILGFAFDVSFRSARGAQDDIVPALERAKKWGEIELRYTNFAKVAKEVCPSIVWGNDWNGNGIPVAKDPAESFVDLPHFEWHPGRTLAQVSAGMLPPYPTQCPSCRNFPASTVDSICFDCRGTR